MSCSPSGKGVDAAAASHSREAAPQVALEAGGRLIAVLGGLGEELHDDRRDRPGIRAAARPAAPAAAMWQCTRSIGSDAVNGRAPVSIS